MNAYIDIDGVLLTKKGQVPDSASELIDFLIANFKCHWLTTHCQGNKINPLKYLSQYYAKDIMQLLEQVSATTWDSLKTSAIDFKNPFVWLEDQPMQAEILVLEKGGWNSSLIVVDLEQPNELRRIISSLEKEIINYQ